MSESCSQFDDKNVVLALRRENETLASELSQLMAEEKKLLLQYSEEKANYLSRVKKGGSALTAHFDLSRKEDREKIILESASRVEYLINTNTAPSYRVDASGCIVSGNNACARLLGYDREDFYGCALTADDLVPKEYRALESDCRTDFSETIVTRTIVTERITKSGKKIPVACNMRLTRADGSQFAVFLMDLSDAKTMEEELKQRQALFSTLVQELPNMIFLVDNVGHTWQFNRRFYELTGLDPAKEDGTFPTQRAHPDDLARSQERWQAAIANHTPLVGEVRVLGASGEYYWHIFRAIPIVDPLPGQLEGLLQLAGSVCPQVLTSSDPRNDKYWIGTSTDIDNRKRMIDDVLESAYNFQSLADQIPQIVWTAGPDGRIDFFNNRWFEFTGLDRELRMGLDFALFIHADDRKNYVSTWKSCVKTGDALDVEFRLKKKARGTAAFTDEDYEKFLARAVAVRNSRGDVEQWVGTWTSI
jgi:PAS domain S-box-containing protein